MIGASHLFVNVCINIKIFKYYMIIILKDLFYYFGAMGPIILYIISLNVLWDKPNLFFYYNVGAFSNIILNLILKGLIKQPRPSEDVQQFNIALKNGTRFLFRNGIPHDIFGMPSGHSQSAFFSMIFLFLSIKKGRVLYVSLFICLITMAQRVAYNYHTLLQVICGAIVGACFGYFVYYLARLKIKGHITEKLDDFAPI